MAYSHDLLPNFAQFDHQREIDVQGLDGAEHRQVQPGSWWLLVLEAIDGVQVDFDHFCQDSLTALGING
ncbi:hypothetical protein [Pseudomonas glycinae]|uniref:hypothetical protein n=1 Tax=Pseudomonas glycinae TaxID=1785145 RepID=UPI001CBA5FB2|nr:hypothetical protein [Pseudomonas glycinae]